jgi:hypothetical protein
MVFYETVDSIKHQLSAFGVNLIMTKSEEYVPSLYLEQIQLIIKRKNGAHITERRTNAKSYGST